MVYAANMDVVNEMSSFFPYDDGAEISEEIDRLLIRDDVQFEKERLSHENFRNKLNSEEAIPIKLQIRDFYNDFEQKTKNVFGSPEEQSQYLREFLNNLSRAIIENPLWANSDREEQENAIVEMEKLITKKFFNITFGPLEDLEKDSILSRTILVHSWVEPRHLDLPDLDYHIFENAGNELSKMNLYRFYIDKMICIVNCIKLVEYAYRKNVSDEEISNDKIIALLIFVILKANPKRLISNVQYIIRYVNSNLLSINIYNIALANIWGAITYIEKISQTELSITPEEYDAKVSEMTLFANEKLEEFNQNRALFSEIDRTNSNVQSLIRYVASNDGANDLNEGGDYPYQGIFTHLDSVNSAASVNRNGSSLSSNSININEYRKELREYYANHKNEPMTNPFSTNLSDEEKNVLFKVDKEIKASLSISSNKDINE